MRAHSGRVAAGRSEGSVADIVRPLITTLFGDRAPLRFEFWDGSTVGEDGGGGRVLVRAPEALKQLLWAPGELGIARAFVLGTLDLSTEGSGDPAAAGGDDALVGILRTLLDAMSNRMPTSRAMIRPLLEAAWKLRLLSVPPHVPSSEVRLTGRWRPTSIHTRERDAEAIRHHYDIGNEFYELVLGPTLTYSCARFEIPGATLEQAQTSKHELVCRKLGLAEADRPGGGRAPRLLDVGCGWGSMAIHAAKHHGAEVVGVTLSPAQAALAKKRIADAGLTDRIDIRIEDYRDLAGERFDAISSIGMFEHVGEARMAEYFATLYGLLEPQGRLLNHAISSVGSSKMRGRTFMNRYVFPDGELIDVSDVVGGMERAGFEVRDVESLREHYARTLRCWVANLERHWDEAVELVGPERARVWRLYMSASVNGFDDGGIAIHQVLGVRPAPGGASGMPLTRAGWG